MGGLSHASLRGLKERVGLLLCACRADLPDSAFSRLTSISTPRSKSSPFGKTRRTWHGSQRSGQKRDTSAILGLGDDRIADRWNRYLEVDSQPRQGNSRSSGGPISQPATSRHYPPIFPSGTSRRPFSSRRDHGIQYAQHTDASEDKDRGARHFAVIFHGPSEHEKDQGMN